jgi:hypothetical protein
MTTDKILGTVMGIVAKLPVEAVKGFADMLSAVLQGKPDKAAQLAKLVSETIAIKAAGSVPFRARGR